MPTVRSLMTGIPDIPPFRLLLAPGWETIVVDQGSADDLARRASERIRHLGRPDVDARLAADIRRSFSSMKKAGSRIAYLPTAVGEGALVPMSMVASVVSGPNGGSLDPYVTQLFREKGAQPFDSEKSTVRWETRARGSDDLTGATSLMISYVIAVPDTGRRRAVVFTATVFDTAQEPLDPDLMADCVALSDAMISTFAWVAPDAVGAATSAVAHPGTVGTSPH